MRLLKIKLATVKEVEKINLIWEAESKSGVHDEFSLTCSDEAMPSFYQALSALTPHMNEICELPDLYMERLTVKSVSFSYVGEKEVWGCVISGDMRLDKSVSNLNINTPFKLSDSMSDQPAAPEQMLSTQCILDILTLIDECKLYIRGDRAQTNLFASEKKESQETQLTLV